MNKVHSMSHVWTARLLALLMVLTLLAGMPGQPLTAQSGPQGEISDDAWAKMSTPTRIDSALERGVIDKETRVLYLAYAVFDQASLPAEYLSTVGWYGTRAVAEVKQVQEQKSVDGVAISARTQAELDRMLAPTAATYCDRDDGDAADTSTYFAISYFSSGANAIAAGMDLAAYKTSLDFSYNALVNSYGWAQPPVCGQAGINCGTSPPDGKFPVLITNLGNGLFGYVTGGGIWAPFSIGDNPNTALTETASTTTCMVLNSDYGTTNFGANNTAQENLDGTTSHEFVHAIQGAWGDPRRGMDAMWAESTAAYFEDEVFDSGNSQYIYLYGDFNNNSLGDWAQGTSQQKDYENFIFFRYIAEQYGGANSSTGGEKVIQKFFENVATSTPAVDKELASFKNAVEGFALGGGSGTSTFADVFHDFAIALKFVKDCQDQPGYGSKYCFEEGTEYRAATRNYQETGNVPAVASTVGSTSGSYAGTIKSDYGISWVRLPANGNGNYKVSLSSSSTTSLKASLVCDTGAAFVINTFTSLVTDSTPHGYNTYNPTGCNDVVLVITNQAETVTRASVDASAPAATHNYNVQLTPVAGTNPTAIQLSRQAASSRGDGLPFLPLLMGGLLLFLASAFLSVWYRRRYEI